MIRALPAPEWRRFYLPLVVGLTILALAWGVVVLWAILHDPAFGPPGGDRTTYMEATTRWLAGGSFYDPRQLGGPYEIWDRAILYPPVALYLFVPFTVLPAVLWWTPVAIVAWAIWHHRPAPWGWPVIAICLSWHTSQDLVYNGNPGIWAGAAVALGTLYGWPALAVAIKPTLAPFVLVGVKRRSWWLALPVAALLALPFGMLWLDWWHAATNIYGWRVGPLYSLGDAPLVVAPVVAWLSRTR